MDAKRLDTLLTKIVSIFFCVLLNSSFGIGSEVRAINFYEDPTWIQSGSITRPDRGELDNFKAKNKCYQKVIVGFKEALSQDEIQQLISYLKFYNLNISLRADLGSVSPETDLSQVKIKELSINIYQLRQNSLDRLRKKWGRRLLTASMRSQENTIYTMAIPNEDLFKNARLGFGTQESFFPAPNNLCDQDFTSFVKQILDAIPASEKFPGTKSSSD